MQYRYHFHLHHDWVGLVGRKLAAVEAGSPVHHIAVEGTLGMIVGAAEDNPMDPLAVGNNPADSAVAQRSFATAFSDIAPYLWYLLGEYTMDTLV